MAYRLFETEPLDDAVLRIAGEELTKAIERLEGGSDRDEAIHAARLKLKKTRALLRFARFGLGERVYRRENDALRDAARQLSGARDAVVRLETYEALTLGGDLDDLPLLYARLISDRASDEATRDGGTKNQSSGATLDAAIDSAVTALCAARARVSLWPTQALTWRAVDAGVRETYRRGAEAMSHAYADGRPEAFHAWRKQVKYARHHVQLLSPSWPEILGETADAAKRLSDLLGLDHDLWDLDAAARSLGRKGRAERDRLRVTVSANSAALRNEARRLADRLYAETPKAYARRLAAYRSAWRTQGAVSATSDIAADAD